jgi:large subunit ribosomal protein L6
MSRVGKLPIKVPNDIKINISGSNINIAKGNNIKDYDFGDKVDVTFKDNEIRVAPKPELDKNKVAVYYGLHQRNINNIVKGLQEPYRITLEINGVGFKATVVKSNLILSLGYSHDIAFGIPSNVTTKVEQSLIHLDSDDKQLLGQIASEIISLRKPEPYKGKGIKVHGKAILRKEGKKK